MDVPSAFGHAYPGAHCVQFAFPATAYHPESHRNMTSWSVYGQWYPAVHVVHSPCPASANVPAAHAVGETFGVAHELPAVHSTQWV
jgi:hypothetical protein